MTPARGGRTKAEPSHRARAYWDKARRFRAAALANLAAGLEDPATANAVNAAINLVDAFCVDLLGERNASGAHEEALAILARAESLDAGTKRALTAHLTSLLHVKNLAQYEGRSLNTSEGRDALRHMERAFKAAEPFATERGWKRTDGSGGERKGARAL